MTLKNYIVFLGLCDISTNIVEGLHPVFPGRNVSPFSDSSADTLLGLLYSQIFSCMVNVFFIISQLYSQGVE